MRVSEDKMQTIKYKIAAILLTVLEVYLAYLVIVLGAFGYKVQALIALVLFVMLLGAWYWLLGRIWK